MVTDQYLTASLNSCENTKVVSQSYSENLAATTYYNYYENANFELTKEQISSITDIPSTVNYNKFSYAKQYSPSTNYQKYRNNGYGTLQAYILNAMLYAEYYQEKVNSTDFACFEFRFNIADNENSYSIDNGNLTYINNMLTSIQNNYGFKLQLVPDFAYQDSYHVEDYTQKTTTLILIFKNPEVAGA